MSMDRRLCITVRLARSIPRLLKVPTRVAQNFCAKDIANDEAAVSEGHGDAAVELLKAGAEIDKRDLDGRLAIDLAPDAKVMRPQLLLSCRYGCLANHVQIRSYIYHHAEAEGIDLDVT